MVRTEILMPSLSRFVGDMAGRPLLVPVQLFDPGHRMGSGGGRLVVRHARLVEQTELAELAKAVHPFAGAGSGDAHLGGDVGEGAGLATLDESAAALGGQRSGTVRRGRVLPVGGCVGGTSHPAVGRPVPSVQPVLRPVSTTS